MTRKNRKNGFDLIGLEIEQERTRCRERMKKNMQLERIHSVSKIMIDAF